MSTKLRVMKERGYGLFPSIAKRFWRTNKKNYCTTGNLEKLVGRMKINLTPRAYTECSKILIPLFVGSVTSLLTLACFLVDLFGYSVGPISAGSYKSMLLSEYLSIFVEHMGAAAKDV